MNSSMVSLGFLFFSQKLYFIAFAGALPHKLIVHLILFYTKTKVLSKKGLKFDQSTGEKSGVPGQCRCCTNMYVFSSLHPNLPQI